VRVRGKEYTSKDVHSTPLLAMTQLSSFLTTCSCLYFFQVPSCLVSIISNGVDFLRITLFSLAYPQKFILSIASAVHEMAPLYPQHTQNSIGYLQVSQIHEVYYEKCGSPTGVPMLFLHGGPGAGISERDRYAYLLTHSPFHNC
jgi:hypothetical protein